MQSHWFLDYAFFAFLSLGFFFTIIYNFVNSNNIANMTWYLMNMLRLLISENTDLVNFFLSNFLLSMRFVYLFFFLMLFLGKMSNVWVHWLRQDADTWPILETYLYHVTSSVSEHWTQAKYFILWVRFVYC